MLHMIQLANALWDRKIVAYDVRQTAEDPFKQEKLK